MKTKSRKTRRASSKNEIPRFLFFNVFCYYCVFLYVLKSLIYKIKTMISVDAILSPAPSKPAPEAPVAATSSAMPAKKRPALPRQAKQAEPVLVDEPLEPPPSRPPTPTPRRGLFQKKQQPQAPPPRMRGPPPAKTPLKKKVTIMHREKKPMYPAMNNSQKMCLLCDEDVCMAGVSWCRKCGEGQQSYCTDDGCIVCGEEIPKGTTYCAEHNPKRQLQTMMMKHGDKKMKHMAKTMLPDKHTIDDDEEDDLGNLEDGMVEDDSGEEEEESDEGEYYEGEYEEGDDEEGEEEMYGSYSGK